MSKKLSNIFIIAPVALFPVVSLAVDTPTDLKGFIGIFGSLFVQAVPVLIGILVLVFVWGLVVFLNNAGDEEKVKEGKQLMFWGVISIFVAVSFWGILSFFSTTFGFDFFIPLLPTSS